MISHNLPVGIKIAIPFNVDIWWVSQREENFAYLTCYLGQYCSKLYQYCNDFTQCLAWYIHPNDIKT